MGITRDRLTHEPLAAMCAHAKAGYCSVITYQKSRDEEIPERVVEPIHFVHGVAQIMVRSFQYLPEEGLRLFCPERITTAKQSTIRRVRPSEAFLEGVVSVQISNPDRAQPRPERNVGEYMQLVRDATLDLKLDAVEIRELNAARAALNLSLGEVRAAHAAVFAEQLHGLASDFLLDSKEVKALTRMHKCLNDLGWSPADVAIH